MHDIIIIGGGINGLIAGNLLAKKGKSVLIFEAKEKAGGMYSTFEFHPGFSCNLIHDHLPWIDKVSLKKLQLDTLKIKSKPNIPYHIGLDESSKHLFFSNSLDSTMKSIGAHSTKDAEKWPLFINYVQMLTEFIKPLYFSIPPKIKNITIKDALALKELFYPLKKFGSRGLVELLRAAPMMMPELLDEWFESKLLRGNLSAIGVKHLNQGPFSAATVLNFLHQIIYSKGEIFRPLNIEGGNDAFIKTILDHASKNGVTIKLNTAIKRINCKNNTCKSVIDSEGKEYQGKYFISSIDLNNTFNKLIGSKYLPPNFKRQVNNIKYRGSSARIHFALNELPKIPNVKDSEMEAILSINPSINYLERAHDDIKYGNYSQNPHLTLAFPSIANPDLAPKGKSVMSATVQHIPYKLKNEDWNDRTINEISQIIINTIQKYIPNFSQYIEHQFLMTPQDFENSLKITEGNFHHGELCLDQFYFMRPTMKSAQYSTPFNNLFLCGSGTHPGGMCYGANAHNTVKKILNS
tara:strand:- start:634 stop:2196 length:1563 start_codon:yes stop_codon:yes gene_type:complete